MHHQSATLLKKLSTYKNCANSDEGHNLNDSGYLKKWKCIQTAVWKIAGKSGTTCYLLNLWVWLSALHIDTREWAFFPFLLQKFLWKYSLDIPLRCFQQDSNCDKWHSGSQAPKRHTGAAGKIHTTDLQCIFVLVVQIFIFIQKLFWYIKCKGLLYCFSIYETKTVWTSGLINYWVHFWLFLNGLIMTWLKDNKVLGAVNIH